MKKYQDTQSLMKLELTHKGEHPGEVIAKILKDWGCSQRRLAIAVDEFPQTIWAIVQGKRSMNTKLANKIEIQMNLPTGYLMTLQLFHDLTKQ